MDPASARMRLYSGPLSMVGAKVRTAALEKGLAMGACLPSLGRPQPDFLAALLPIR